MNNFFVFLFVMGDSAARATDDHATRRHVRGGYFAGTAPEAGVEEFIKNAAR